MEKGINSPLVKSEPFEIPFCPPTESRFFFPRYFVREKKKRIQLNKRSFNFIIVRRFLSFWKAQFIKLPNLILHETFDDLNAQCNASVVCDRYKLYVSNIEKHNSDSYRKTI